MSIKKFAENFDKGVNLFFSPVGKLTIKVFSYIIWYVCNVLLMWLICICLSVCVIILPKKTIKIFIGEL